jgi:hypothetical protein
MIDRTCLAFDSESTINTHTSLICDREHVVIVPAGVVFPRVGVKVASAKGIFPPVSFSFLILVHLRAIEDVFNVSIDKT